MSGEKAAPAARLDRLTERDMKYQARYPAVCLSAFDSSRLELIALIGTLTPGQTAEVIRRAMREGLLVK